MPCEFKVKIMGKKGHSHWEYKSDHYLLFYSTYEPLSEDANRELVTEIAEAVGVNKSKVHLIHGVEDQHKVFMVPCKVIPCH